jgi:Na+-transporting methylmalonyl-CoA/oxaloacetate decarboxylase gamma subunit
MGERLGEASTLIGVGMAVVFLGLVMLMASIMIINRLVPDRVRKAGGQELLEAIETDKSDGERAAVLAVALARAIEGQGVAVRELRTVNLVGGTGEPSRWAVSGREQAMLSRGKAGRQWGRRSS